MKTMPRLIDADALRVRILTTTFTESNMWALKLMIGLIDDAPTVGGWISVKGGMPVEKENPLTHDFAEVICFCDFGGLPRQTDIRIYKFGKPSWATKPHFWSGPQNMDEIVTHWMPLPEPPKEEHDAPTDRR